MREAITQSAYFRRIGPSVFGLLRTFVPQTTNVRKQNFLTDLLLVVAYANLNVREFFFWRLRMSTKAVGTAMIPATHKERHAPDARMLILLTCENFPVKTLRGLARRHNAHTVIDPNSNMAAITVAYDHNRVESVLGMLANARIEVSRQNASLESIVKAVRKTKHSQPIVF